MTALRRSEPAGIDRDSILNGGYKIITAKRIACHGRRPGGGSKAFFSAPSRRYSAATAASAPARSGAIEPKVGPRQRRNPFAGHTQERQTECYSRALACHRSALLRVRRVASQMGGYGHLLLLAARPRPLTIDIAIGDNLSIPVCRKAAVFVKIAQPVVLLRPRRRQSNPMVAGGQA